TPSPTIPAISITKTADRTTASPGDAITYSVKLSNPAGVTTDNLRFTDQIPSETVFNGDAGVSSFSGFATGTQPQVACSNTVGISTLSCTISPIPSGGSVTVT